MNKFFTFRWMLIATLLGVFSVDRAVASVAYGSINNFDTVNDTGVECHGFEIEIEDCHSTNITYTYDYNHYGTSQITEDNSVAGHPKCIVRWESKKNADGTWAAYTAIPSGPIAPTNGHMFTNPAVNFGGEHFGVGYNAAVTTVRYHWLIDNGSGALMAGGAVQVSTPTFTYYPAVVNVAPPQVQAVIAPPPPPAPEPLEFGKPVWMKEIRTSSHNNREVKLRDLVSDDPADPNDKNWRNGEPDEVETEWQLLQKDYNKGDGGANNLVPAAAENLPGGDEVVTRRYEFYKYTGPLDTETGEAMAGSVAADGVHGTGSKTINGVLIDLSTKSVVGEYTGSQMAAVDVDAPVGLIDHVSEGEVNRPYAARTLVIEGSLPATAVCVGDLPPGMAFDEMTGVLSGTPTASGQFSFNVTATDVINPDVSKNYTLTVAAAGVALAPASLLDTTSSPVNSGTTTGDGSFVPGSQVTVAAQPYAGYHFVNWTDNGAVVSQATSYTFTIDVNHSLVANFAADVAQWNIASSSSSLLGGIVNGGGTVDDGSSVTLVATPNLGYAFVNWTEAGIAVSAAASYTFTATADRTLVANFAVVPTYSVTTSANPSAGGVTLGNATYSRGSSATVTATANAGYVFHKWTDGGSTNILSQSYTFAVTANRNLVANFVLAGEVKTIATSASPTAGGSTSGGGNCIAGEIATVVATANPNYKFSKWQEGSTTVSTSAAYTFTVAANRTLVAKFIEAFVITAAASPSVGGSTEMDSLTYKTGEKATAKAFSSSGYHFVSWTENGTVVSTSASYDFNVTGNRSISANFASDNGVTVITHSAPAFNGNTFGDGGYNIGDAVTVSANPEPGFAFANWTVDGTIVSDSADYTFTATASSVIVANFVPAIAITCSTSPAIGGVVHGAGDFVSGANVTLEAAAEPGFIFRNWTEAGTGVSDSAIYSFNVTAPRSLVANFSPAYTITASASPLAGGNVLGMGTVKQGSSITLVATAMNDCTFVNWTDANGNEVSTSPSYTFTPTSDIDLYANFSAGIAGVHFDFDSADPLLALHTAAPFSQTAAGLTATFSSPNDARPTVESLLSLGYTQAKVAGQFLAPSDTAGTVIDVNFSSPVSGVRLNFATIENLAVAIGSNLTLTAIDHSSGSPVVVGSALAHGVTALGDTFPSGTLAFNSGATFDSIRIELTSFPNGAQQFLIDNLVVSPAGSNVGGGTMLLANPNWNITLSDYGYSDYLLDQTPGFEGREYLSGEWGSAIAYTKDGVDVAPTWLDPQFLYPDWSSNSNFQVVQGIHLVGTNVDGLPISESVITNSDLEITLRFEMVDTVVGTPMGITPASSGGTPKSIASNRYVLNQSFKVRNISGASIANVQLFQLLHGFISQRGVYDNRTYTGKLSQYHYDATLTGVDAGSAGAKSSTIGLEDTIAFHSKVAPTAFEIGNYGIEGNGIDDHVIGKPSDGVHLSIEDNWQNAPYNTRQGRDSFAPAQRWVAGGQRWSLGNLSAGQQSNFDLVLSLLTGTKVTVDGGGSRSSGSCNGGSTHAGGVDFEFDEATSEGTFFGQFSEADDTEMDERENEGQFALPSYPKVNGGSRTQLWNLSYSGSHNGLIHLTFAYQPSLLPANFNETKLAIYHYNGSIWEKLPGTVDTVNKKISVTTSSLSPFALGANALDDQQVPVITLVGNATVTISLGDPYLDAGATATDNVDGSVSVITTGSVNTTVPGTYTLTYSASDTAGNLAKPVTRTVTVTSAGFRAWTYIHTGGAAANLDTDHDGVSNGIEYFMNAPSGVTVNPAPDATKTVTWANGGNIASSQYGIEFEVETSADLSTWTPVASDDANLSNTSKSVSYTVTGSGKRFVRLKLTPN